MINIIERFQKDLNLRYKKQLLCIRIAHFYYIFYISFEFEYSCIDINFFIQSWTLCASKPNRFIVIIIKQEILLQIQAHYSNMVANTCLIWFLWFLLNNFKLSITQFSFFLQIKLTNSKTKIIQCYYNIY